jgi:hypothetical protein
MHQRETFVLKLRVVEESDENGKPEKRFNATLQSANTGGHITFNSLHNLIEYLKVWNVRANAETDYRRDERT